MLSLLPLLPLLAGATPIETAKVQDDWVVLGEVPVFGQTDPDGRKEPVRNVQLKFPASVTSPPEITEAFDYAGGRVALNNWGNFDHIYWGQGGWQEFRAMRERALANIAAGKAVPWKVKAILFTRTDLLKTDKNGVLTAHDSVMFDDDITLVLESFVRMEALVEAFSEGAVDLKIDYSIERDPITAEYANQPFVWNEQLASLGFYQARFNYGDYDSVLSTFAAADADVLYGGQGMYSNGASHKVVLYSNGAERAGEINHTERLLTKFYETVRTAAIEHGYGTSYQPLLPSPEDGLAMGYSRDGMGYAGMFGWLRDYGRLFLTAGLWKEIASDTPIDYRAAFDRLKPYSGEKIRWGDISADPWSGMPLVSYGDIAKQIGADSLNIEVFESTLMINPVGGTYRTPMKPRGQGGDTMLNNHLDLSREAVARIGYGDRDLLFIRPDLADFVIRHLGDHPAGSPPPANVMGVVFARRVPLVVVDTKLSNDTLAEANLVSYGSEKTGIGVFTKGIVERGDPVSIRFGTDIADARFTVADSNGNGITLSNGELQLPTQEAATHVLKAMAALPSGERIERFFVVRVVDPISIDRFGYWEGRLMANVTNYGPERQISVDVQLPSGWSAEPIREMVPSYYSGSFEVVPRLPSGPLGTGGATLSVSVPGRQPAIARTALQAGSGDTLVRNTFEAGTEGWDAPRWDSGTYTVVRSSPPNETNNFLSIADGGGARFGRVTAYGRVLADGRSDPEFAGYSVEDYPYVNLKLKSDGKAPLALTFMVNGRRFVAMITGEPEQRMAGGSLLDRVKFVPDGTWQQISYNLAEALPGSQGRRFVTEIAFGDPRQMVTNPFRSSRVNQHLVDDFEISKAAAEGAVTTDPDAEINLIGDLNSPDPYLQALAIAKATGTPEEMVIIRQRLRSEDNTVRVNAAAALTRIKDPESIPALLDASRLERVPYPAVMMVRALAFQDTPESWAGLKTVIRQGRAEELSVAEAARLMGEKNDPSFIEDLSILITARSWSARRAGAMAMGSLPTDPGAQMLMTYLLEVDPMVRLRVAQMARVDVDPVGRRMEWGSVNDLSNIVRAYSYAALTKSADPLLRSRGYAGLKEDDPEIRMIVASALRTAPQESHVAPLMALLSDPVPAVRAAAVTSLMQMPGARSFSDMSVLNGEYAEEVLYPLLDAARERKIELPRAMLDRLATHRNPLIRDRVKELIR